MADLVTGLIGAVVPSELVGYLVGLGGILAALLTTYIKGRSDGGAKAENIALKERLAEKERVDALIRDADYARRNAQRLRDDPNNRDNH